MNLYEQLNRAIEIAVKVHEGQTDLNGQPYLGHPFRVMAAGHTLQEKIVGVLHDVIEKGMPLSFDITFARLTDVRDALKLKESFATSLA